MKGFSDSIGIIKTVRSLFHIICFEVAILGHKDTVDAARAHWADPPPLLGAKHALSDQILQEELLLVHLQCVSKKLDKARKTTSQSHS